MLKVANLSVHYGGMQALADVSIVVNEGEILSIVGSNGAGKTTFINAVSGMRNVTNGKIEFLGEDITKISAHDRVPLGIVQVPEGRKLFSLMSVEENLLLGSSHTKAKEKRKETLEYVYQLLPRLYDRRNQVSKTLSGGEQQMVAIGRALMSQPKLLMFDEPSLGLSPLLVKELFQLIKDINRQGVTVMLVEQNVKQTLSIADRSYVLENGHISLSGTGQELLNNDHVKKAFLGM
ncbi:amino acid ABC transporter ATPase [Ureibacillus massiliensis 4400831 = CIP 108448 = CCUG 49529]|uniref:Amino acid ABC transporter ATPase n=1 Tax=Ureibacillus massiliensis 4400831 = CIP 108448 = CCUG 49529 TaxID=1211035 RepID=A0A0A3J692_9BACL|nr:ABC transporter ATP-binding protein [Ureibacillus massiliensis]KGR90683.1 amino acid ABC transporter ATPase [Ureibacillus massiliensis 4400831 = CIP 108448 = CCUG 49529]